MYPYNHNTVLKVIGNMKLHILDDKSHDTFYV